MTETLCDHGNHVLCIGECTCHCHDEDADPESELTLVRRRGAPPSTVARNRRGAGAQLSLR